MGTQRRVYTPGISKYQLFIDSLNDHFNAIENGLAMARDAPLFSMFELELFAHGYSYKEYLDHIGALSKAGETNDGLLDSDKQKLLKRMNRLDKLESECNLFIKTKKAK